MSVADFVNTARDGLDNMIRLGTDIARQHPDKHADLTDQLSQAIRVNLETAHNLRARLETHLQDVGHMRVVAQRVSHITSLVASWMKLIM